VKVVTASQSTGVEITAVVYPACVCGHPYYDTSGTLPHHGCSDPTCRCQGYKPIRPIENLGTRVYRPWTTMALWRKVVCKALWTVEYTAESWRGRLLKPKE
jgi:hypothetical protein